MRLILKFLSVFSVLMVMAWSIGADNSAGVTIRDMQFQPSSVNISAGGKVTWSNKDDRDHKVNFADGTLSPNLKPGASWSRTFKSAGTYSYSCEYRPRMKGKVVVE
jgi:plastocyanin